MKIVKTIKILLLIGFALLLCFPSNAMAADEPKKPDLDKFFEKKIRNTEILPIPEIKDGGLNREFEYTTYENMWDSVIKIIIQNGIIINLSKTTGIIVALSDMTVPAGPGQKSPFKPLGPLNNTIYLFVERSPDKKDTITVFLRADKPVSKPFFDKLSTQLYSAKKWEYLK